MPSGNRGLTLALALVLCLAAALRFVGLGWGLRHAPEVDERLFVESVAEMIRHHDFDQRFYEYPGLFFHLLRVPLAMLSSGALGSSQAYLFSRGLVAAFGLVSVALAFVLGRRLVSSRAGVFAALVLAVAPIEVSTAHMVRPDVVLETCVLAFFLVLAWPGQEPIRDALAGLALGAATAVKPTGALLLASFALDRARRPGRRALGLAVAGLAAATVFVTTTPFLLIAPARFVASFKDQWAYHYDPTRIAGSSFLFYLETLGQALGPAGCVLLFVGLWQARARPDVWAPLLAFPLVLVGVLSSAPVHWPRLLLPTLGVVALVAALGFEQLASRSPRTAWLLALGSALVPLATSISFVREVAEPGTRDRAVSWIDENLAAGSAILTQDPTLGIDPQRFEVFHSSGRADHDLLLAQSVDLVVSKRGQAPLVATELSPVLVLPSRKKAIGPWLSLFALPEPRPRPLTISPTMLEASSDGEGLAALLDGRLDTGWRATETGQERGWLQILLGRQVRVARVELLLGDKPDRAGRSLAISVSVDGTTWRPVPLVLYRPIAAGPKAIRQVIVLDETPVQRIRISAAAPPRHRWGGAELRIEAVP